MTDIVIGVLALQGAFIEHIVYFNRAIKELGLEDQLSVTEVRTPAQLNSCKALVIPGGESTAISLIAERSGMFEPLRKFANDESKAVWGTCAGLIFCASSIVNKSVGQKSLGCLDIEVTRNAFGRQLDSFTANLDFSKFIKGCEAYPTTFIRAPVVSGVGKNVEVLYKLDEKDKGLIVAVRQGRKLGTSFHPELSVDCSIHKYFVEQFVC